MENELFMTAEEVRNFHQRLENGIPGAEWVEWFTQNGERLLNTALHFVNMFEDNEKLARELINESGICASDYIDRPDLYAFITVTRMTPEERADFMGSHGATEAQGDE